MFSPQSLLTLTRHEEYYISSADLSILVEQVRFRVHRFFFERESEYFRRELATPATPGVMPQGSNDSNAIILEGITAFEFTKFLWVFYNPQHSLYDAPVSDWEIILRLANNWVFPEVKKLVVRELEKKELSDVERIQLYHKNDVDRNILIPRYASLCERETPLTLAEGIALGMETTLMIAAAREEARSRLPSGARSPLSPTIHGADLHQAIRELFKIVPSAETDLVEDSTSPAVASTTGGLAKPKPVEKPTQAPKIPPTPTAAQKAAQGPTGEQSKKKQAKNPAGQQSTPASDKKVKKAAAAAATPPTNPRKEGDSDESVAPPTPVAGQHAGQTPAQTAEAEAGKKGGGTNGEMKAEGGEAGNVDGGKKASEGDAKDAGDEKAKGGGAEAEAKETEKMNLAATVIGDATTTKGETPAANNEKKTETTTPSSTPNHTTTTNNSTAALPAASETPLVDLTGGAASHDPLDPVLPPSFPPKLNTNISNAPASLFGDIASGLGFGPMGWGSQKTPASANKTRGIGWGLGGQYPH